MAQLGLDLGNEVKVPKIEEAEVLEENDEDPRENPSKKKTPNIESSWLEALGNEFQKPYMDELRDFLVSENQSHTVYPPNDQIFNAFWKTPIKDVKVVILGQDPYHGPKQAHGLCFSVQHGVQAPPSLRNIFLELNQSLGITIPKHGCLEKWAEQGVFLLNTSLTVRAGSPQSHAGKGWEIFTDKVIETLNEKCENLVFLLWGSPARKKASMIDRKRHLILEAPHPSPLSAHRGFIGCGHFKQANEYLMRQGKDPVDWSL